MTLTRRYDQLLAHSLDLLNQSTLCLVISPLRDPLVSVKDYASVFLILGKIHVYQAES
jgi:hypothetical protein